VFLLPELVSFSSLSLFDRIVDVARIKHGNRQTIDTLISEEALLFAKYLRNERKCWNPRIPIV
jgi:hypothetical protein